MNNEENKARAEELRQQANERDRRAQESFERCDTDGFLSQWAANLTADKLRIEADIVEAGGVAEFPALFYLDSGKRVPAKLIDTRYGSAWAILDRERKFTGEFITAFPKRASTMARKGYREGHEIVQAKAVITGRGHGLSGSSWATAIRLDGGCPEEAILGIERAVIAYDVTSEDESTSIICPECLEEDEFFKAVHLGDEWSVKANRGNPKCSRCGRNIDGMNIVS